jgi:anti-sigma factor (TIGR02949 family)
MISCADAVRQLWEYLDNVLSPEDYEQVEGHLAFCRRCCGELEFAAELQHFLRTKRGSQLPDHTRARLEAFIDSLEREETG